MNEKLPIDSTVNIEEPSRKHPFTGSQVKTVILNTATELATRSMFNQKIYQNDFMRFAELENRGSFESEKSNSIGFM
ncbi:MAG: hypothetical protein P1R58_08675 [bacterium]|nr:hypothetical protein [bacterium]